MNIMNKEKWKPVVNDLFTRYEVSNLGNIRNDRGMILKPSFVAGGLAVTLCENGVMLSQRVTRLVGAAWCKGYSSRLYPVYLDGDRWNCSAANLKWVSRCDIPRGPNKRKASK